MTKDSKANTTAEGPDYLAGLRLLNDIAVEAATLDLSVFLRVVVTRATEALAADAGVVYLADEKVLRARAYCGVFETMKAWFTIPFQHPGSLCSLAFMEHRAVWSNGPEDAPQTRAFLTAAGLRSAVAAPIFFQQRAIGALAVARGTDHPFTPAEVRLMYGLGAQLGLVVENSRLYEDLRRSYEALNEAQSALVRRERLAALGELAAQVAHEVRNPLAAICNVVSLLKKETASEDRRSPLIHVVEQETARLSAIVEELLNFARPELRVFHEVQLALLVENALHQSLDPQKYERIQIEVAVDPTLVIRVEERLMRQALHNLFVNAAQAIERSGVVRVTALTESKADAPWIRIDVADTGRGIPPETLGRVFEPFFTTKATGTGLGLAVVRRVIDLHGGEVSVASTVGQGTTVTLRLPLQSDSAPR